MLVLIADKIEKEDWGEGSGAKQVPVQSHFSQNLRRPASLWT